jgi:hypothetical protein
MLILCEVFEKNLTLLLGDRYLNCQGHCQDKGVLPRAVHCPENCHSVAEKTGQNQLKGEKTGKILPDDFGNKNGKMPLFLAIFPFCSEGS